MFVPAGEFQMGSNSDEANEKPVHTVKIAKPFYMGKYKVTQKEWKRVMGKNWSYCKGDRNPVEYASWNECKSFLSRAGGGLRFPTEAEWEYACRAGTATAYSFGDENGELERYAWHSKNSGGKTHPVGGKLPNAWGLYDMHGTVNELCADWYAKDYYSKSPSENPQGPSSGEYRVARGGSWGNSPEQCRSAFRQYLGPSQPHVLFGFRVVRGLPEAVSSALTVATERETRKELKEAEMVVSGNATSAARAESVGAEQGALGDVLLIGDMPVLWTAAKLHGQRREQSVELILSQKTDWEALVSQEGEGHLGIMLCYVRGSSPGEAARLLNTSVFSSRGMGGTLADGRMSFLYFGGNLPKESDRPSPEGAVARIETADGLDSDSLRTSKSIRLPLSAETYARTFRLEGAGRIAFVLQKVSDRAGTSISNIIEMSIDFRALDEPE